MVWANIILRVLSYKGTSELTKINVVQVGEKLQYVTREQMLQHLRHTVNNMTGLGFDGTEVGTHSIRSSLAMALYLAKRPISTIMLLGRWSSDAFLLCIKRQALERSQGVSQKTMRAEDFTSLPPRDSCGHLFQSKNDLSFRSSRASDHVTSPSFSLHH